MLDISVIVELCGGEPITNYTPYYKEKVQKSQDALGEKSLR